MPEPDRDHAVRERAYHIWERDGRPEGQAEAHWLSAAREQSGNEPADEFMDDEEKILAGQSRCEYASVADKGWVCKAANHGGKSRHNSTRDVHLLPSTIPLAGANSPTTLHLSYSTVPTMADAARSTTTLSTKGQVILPAAIRRRHNWRPGTRLTVEETADSWCPAAASAGLPAHDDRGGLRLPAPRGRTGDSVEMRAHAAEVRRRHARGRY